MNHLTTKCKIILYDTAALYEYIYKKITNNPFPTEKMDNIVEKYLHSEMDKLYQGHWTLQNLRDICPRTAYPMPAFVFLSSQIHEAVSLASTYAPQDKALKNLYQELVENLMLFRYDPREDIKEKIKNKISEIKNYLDKIVQISDSNKKRINSVLDLFNDILNYPDLLEISISHLIKNSSFKASPKVNEYYISIIESCKTYKNIFENVAKDIPFVIKTVDNILKKHQNTCFEDAVFLKKLTDLFNKFKDLYIPIFTTLQPNDITKFNEEGFSKFIKLSCAADRLINNLQPEQRIKLMNDFISYDKDYFEGDQKIYFTDSFKYKIKKYEEAFNNAVKDSLEAKQADKIRELYKDLFFCYSLLDGYILNPITSLIGVFSGIKVALKDLTIREINVLNNQYKSQNQTPEIPPPQPHNQNKSGSTSDQRSIEDLLKLIGESPEAESNQSSRKVTKASRSRKSKKSSQVKQSSQTATSVAKKTEPLSSQVTKNVQSTKGSSTLSPSDKIYRETANISTLLSNLCIESNAFVLKGCLRHGQMNLMDAMICHKRLSDPNLPENVKRFYLITSLQTIYFCLEGLLHYENGQKHPHQYEIKGAGHNLEILAREANYKGQDTKLISDLFSANYWVLEPLQQRNIWNNFNQIEVLEDIKQIYESKLTGSSTTNKIKNYLSQTNLFIRSLPSIAHARISNKVSVISPTLTFEHTQNFSKVLKKWKLIYDKFNEMMSKISPTFQPQLVQIISHLKLLEGIIEELQNKKISSDLFGLLVRHLIFWENALLEGCLKMTFHLKTGLVANGHRLGDIYNGINWSKNYNAPGLDFLNDEFENIHTISRYPFNTQKKNTPLYKFIIKSELLRERPELGEGFELSNKKMTTPLNYIEIDEEGLTPQAIVEQLQQTTHRVLNFITNRIIPEIDTCLT